MLLLTSSESALTEEALELVRQRALEAQGERERQLEAASASPFAPRVVAWRLPENDYLVGLIGKQ